MSDQPNRPEKPDDDVLVAAVAALGNDQRALGSNLGFYQGREGGRVAVTVLVFSADMADLGRQLAEKFFGGKLPVGGGK